MTYNLFDDGIPGEPVQLRDEHNKVLWEGTPVDGEIMAEIPRPAIVRWLTKVDGTPMYDFANEARVFQPNDILIFRPDFTLGTA